MSRLSSFGLILLSGMLLVLGGCSSGDSGPIVKGLVTVDGKNPLTYATVEIESQGGGGAAKVITDANGKFVVDTTKSPLKPGNYTVYISKLVDPKTNKPPKQTEEMDLEMLQASGDLKNVVPARYSSREFPEHLLKVNIKAGDNNLKFDVKSR